MSEQDESAAHDRDRETNNDFTAQDPTNTDLDAKVLIARLLGVQLPQRGLIWSDDSLIAPIWPFARLSLAVLAARHRLLVYVTPAEDDSDPKADTMGRALRDHQDALHDLGVRTVGVSTQPITDQHDIGSIELFTQTLLADPDLVLASELGLPVARGVARPEYRPMILIVQGGRVGHSIYPIASPRASAQDALDWLTQHVSE